MGVALAFVLFGCDSGGSVNDPPVVVPPTPAQLLLQLSGVPDAGGNVAALRAAGFGARVRGPGPLDTVLVQSGTLFASTAGRYSVSAPTAEFDSVRYVAAPDSQSIDVTLASTRVISVVYSAITGGLDLRAVGGPPDTTRMSAQLRHPDGRTDLLVLSTRLRLLAPGSYVITPLPRTVNGVLYAPARAADTVVVAAGPITSVTMLSFSAQRATLRLPVIGVPAPDRLGFVTLEGLDQSVRTISLAADTLVFAELPAGTYIVKPQSFNTERARYAAQLSADTIVIAAGSQMVKPLVYDRLTASLAVAISGVPDGANASVTVQGPAGFSRTIDEGALFPDLVPGSYTIQAATFATSEHTYAPLAAAQIVTIGFGVPAQREVTYTLATGALAITVDGLPDSVSADVVVTAVAAATIQGFPWSLTASATRSNVPPGAYLVQATVRFAGGKLYVPSPAQRTVTVGASLEATVANVQYEETVGPLLDYAIDGAYMTQAAQLPSGTVPLVASRAALLRTFVRANQGNNTQLTVRVRLYQGDALYRTLSVPSPTATVPLDVNEGVFDRSWNVLIDAGDVREGMRFVVDFGEAPGVVDAKPDNNRWPLSGTRPVDVRVAPGFAMTLVPVHHPVDGLTGNVTVANAPTLFSIARALFPLQNTQLTVRAPFSTSAPAMLAGDANGAWFTLLNEMNALRIAESAGNAHYAGIVATTYANGVGGIAAIAGRTFISWDKPASAPSVLAHELGHNFGRYHSPGCGAGFIDGSYPYGTGIGGWGWNGTGLMHPLTTNDIMGYCTVQWISDYTWTGVLNYRASYGVIAESALRRVGSTARDSVLLLWGNIASGVAQLEPAFRIVASPSLPPVGRGRFAVEVLDANNRVLSATRFDGDPVDHIEDAHTFAFAVPVRGWNAAAAVIRVREGARVLTQRRVDASASAAAAVTRVRADDGRSLVASPDARVVRRGAASVSVSWNREQWPSVMVRDGATGAVLMFARSPDQVARASGVSALELVFSDGVRSVTRRVVVR